MLAPGTFRISVFTVIGVFMVGPSVSYFIRPRVDQKVIGSRSTPGSSGAESLLVPTEDPQRAQRVPPARPTIAILEREVDRARVGVLQKPPAIGLLLGSEQINC